MNTIPTKPGPRMARAAFTLVEMLVVIAIISILMTAGSIGLSGMGGKGVTSGVATVESLFDEARTIAVSRSTRTRVLVAMDLTNNAPENLRRILVAYAETDPNTGKETSPTKWVLASRATALPDQVFFSKKFSMYDHGDKVGFGATSEMSLGSPGYKANVAGKYLFYEFNSQGICTSPGASFIIGSGARNPKGTSDPRVTAAGKRDFGGFVIWRNGRTSVFRSPSQMGGVDELESGSVF